MDNPHGIEGDLEERVLSSDTRKQILKYLAEKNHRPSDLSRELGKDKSTIVQHLDILGSAGLVERIERDGHKWVFYKLSRKAEVLFPNHRRRAAFFIVALFSLLGALMSMSAYVQPMQGFGLMESASPGIGGYGIMDAKIGQNAENISPESAQTTMVAAIPGGDAEQENLSRIMNQDYSNITGAGLNNELVAPKKSRVSEIFLYAAVALATLFLAAMAQFILMRANELVIPKRKK